MRRVAIFLWDVIEQCHADRAPLGLSVVNPSIPKVVNQHLARSDNTMDSSCWVPVDQYGHLAPFLPEFFQCALPYTCERIAKG